MASTPLLLICFATVLAWIAVGGGLYEMTVVDPFWPRRPELIQPTRGGISRRRFWIPAHVTFELSLIASLVLAWSQPDVRKWLLVALVTQAALRIWSVLDFIPKALAFERADPASITEADARNWARRSMLRLPLHLVTAISMLIATILAGQLV